MLAPALVVVAFVGLMLGSAPAGGQVDPPPPPPDRFSEVGELVNPAWEMLAPLLENETGQDLTREEIDLDLRIDIQNVEYEIWNIVFGGGKVAADVEASLRLEFRAISIERLDSALQNATGDAQVGLNRTFGIDSSRMVLTAEEVRLLGGGVVLQAFQGLQERAAAEKLEELLPGITVLRADFSWENTLPFSEIRQGEVPDLREPPLILEADVTLRYLERFSLMQILESMGEEDADREAEKDMRTRIEENQTLPAEQRSVFMFLGYGQLLDMQLPNGWRLNLTLTVPQGFTIEDASAELLVDDDKRTMGYFMDGSQRMESFSSAQIVLVSNRFLVTVTVGIMVLLAGGVVRMFAEGGVSGLQWVSRKMSGSRNR